MGEERKMVIWYDDDGCLVWHGKNLKPSEIVLMAACLQEHGLKMMNGHCLKCGYCADDCHCEEKQKSFQCPACKKEVEVPKPDNDGKIVDLICPYCKCGWGQIKVSEVL